MNISNSTKLLLQLLILTVPLAHAADNDKIQNKSVDIPSLVDRDKVSAGFNFSLSQTTFTGSKKEYSFVLIPDGFLTLNSVYFGETRFACSNQGGSLSTKLSPKAHSDYMISALQVIKETEGAQARLNEVKYRPDNPPSMLKVEYDNNYYSAIINLATPKEFTKQFLSSSQNAGVEMLKDKKGNVRALSLFEKRDFKTRFIEVKLVNSGNQTLQVKLPPKAQQHFLLRLGDGGMTPLTYKNIPAQLKQILKPGQSMTITLTIPKEVDPASGLLIYDNSPEILGDYEPQSFPNSISVSLCPILPNNSRAEFK